MTKLDQDQLSQIVSAVISALQVQGSASPKPAPEYRNTFGKFDPARKDRQLLAAFKRKGFTDVVLLDRADPSKPFNVKPYGSAEKGTGWLAEGRVVRRGERGVRGLFHITQTDIVGATTNAPASPPKANIPKWRKAAAKAAKAEALTVS